MAGLQQVLDAIGTEARSAISGVPYPAIVYAGWPTQANLQQLVAKGIQSHISVYALPGERNTTRFARDFAVDQLPAITLTATVNAGQLTFEGTVTGDQNVAITIDQAPPVVYTVLAETDLANVALGVAYAIGAAGIPGLVASASGPVVSIAGDSVPAISVVIRGKGTVIQLLRQQEKHVMVTVWAPSPDIREALAEAIDGQLGTVDRLSLPDFPGRIRYQGTYEEEPQDRLQVFRRSLTYSVEWARTIVIPATQIIARRMALAP